ncbi:MAG: pyridoxal phosphate-dependent aminotransferase, partial [Vicinamibacterales bacterium]
GQAVPSFPPPAVALQAAREAIGRPEVDRYTTDPGLPGLRRALAERLGHVANTSIGEDDVIITAGGNHAAALALTTLIEAGDEVILPAPWFTNHQMMVVALGATPVDAPVGDRASFGLRWDDIEPHITPRTRAVVLCNPSNPTGTPLAEADGLRIAGELAQRGITLISDETYMPFVYEGTHWSAAASPAWREHIVVIGTFSKMFGMMGWRVGYMVADASVCAHAIKVQDAMIICAPVISQVAAEAAVRGAWDYPRTFHAELQARQQALADGLRAIPGADWTPTAAGMFGLVRIPGCSDSVRLSLDLVEHAHVVTIPGAAFGAAGEGHLRISFGFASQDEITDAVGRLRDYLAAP